MDQAISPEIKRQRKRKMVVRVTMIVVICVGVFSFLVNMFQPKIRGAEVNFGVVDEGAVEVSVYATGKVVPFAEEIITSPVSSKVLEVYKKSGDRVQKDEPLLQLDLETIRTEYETKKESLEMQLNKLDLQRKTIASDLAEMKMQVDIDEMMLKRTLVSLNNERYLDSIGASTREKVREAELNYTVKQMQLEQLKRKFENKKSTSQSEIRSLELDYKIAKRNMDLLFKTLGEAQVMAPRVATLTWINDQVGASVSQGSNLAILSDLSSFKVEGEIVDSYADKITAGNRVNVVIGNEKLSGTVGNVTPSVNNGIIKFVVFLDDQSNTRLRSGLKVDVHVTHAMKDETLRLPTGAYYMGRGDYDLWVVNGDRVEKRKVMLGESGFEYVEVLQQQRSGDVLDQPLGQRPDQRPHGLRSGDPPIRAQHHAVGREELHQLRGADREDGGLRPELFPPRRGAGAGSQRPFDEDRRGLRTDGRHSLHARRSAPGSPEHGRGLLAHVRRHARTRGHGAVREERLGRQGLHPHQLRRRTPRGVGAVRRPQRRSLRAPCRTTGRRTAPAGRSRRARLPAKGAHRTQPAARRSPRTA